MKKYINNTNTYNIKETLTIIIFVHPNIIKLSVFVFIRYPCQIWFDPALLRFGRTYQSILGSLRGVQDKKTVHKIFKHPSGTRYKRTRSQGRQIDKNSHQVIETIRPTNFGWQLCLWPLSPHYGLAVFTNFIIIWYFV